MIVKVGPRYENNDKEVSELLYEVAEGIHQNECTGHGMSTSFEDWKNGWQDSWIELAAIRFNDKMEKKYNEP